MTFSNRAVAGSLLFSGMIIFLIGLNVSEELYPGYSVSKNYISDLGAICRAGDCQVFQPSSMIFNSCVFIAGLCAMIASYFLWLEYKMYLFPGLLAVAGAGAMGVGLFPEYHPYPHYASAFLAFLFGGLAAISASFVEKSVMHYFSILLGLLTLTASLLMVFHHYLGLGPGGMERMILYPFAIWAVGFGGYLLNPCDEVVSKK
jgi:hypothetical membrane protein